MTMQAALLKKDFDDWFVRLQALAKTAAVPIELDSDDWVDRRFS